MVMLYIAYLSIWSYQGHIRYVRESKSNIFHLHATSKNEIHICSNKHETPLVLVSISDICLNFPAKSVFIKTECHFRSLHSRAGSAFTQLLGQ